MAIYIYCGGFSRRAKRRKGCFRLCNGNGDDMEGKGMKLYRGIRGGEGSGGVLLVALYARHDFNSRRRRWTDARCF